METNVFKFLWKYISKLKILFFGVTSCVIFSEIVFRLFMYFGSQIADLLASDNSRDYIFDKSLFFVGLSALCLLLHRFSYDISMVFEAKFLPVYLSRLYKDLFHYTHKHSTAFFSEEMAGNISGKIKTIADNSYDMYFNLLWGFIYPIIAVCTTFYFVFTVNVEMAFLMLFMNFLYVYIIYKISMKISKYSEIRADKKSRTHGVLVDSISNASLVKSFSNYSYEKKQFFKYVKEYVLAERVEIKKFAILYFCQGIVRLILMVVFCLLPVWYWYKGEVSIGQFVLVQSLVYSLSGVYLHFTQTFMHFFKLYGGIRDGLKLLSKPYDITDAPNAKKLTKDVGDIVFDNVCYHYKTSTPLFDDFSLTIKNGEKVGLVGHSGAGKSTLVKILVRNYDIQRGEIRIGRQNIAKVTQDSLRDAISLIPQDPSLFNRTIMENIRYGKINATEDEIFEAAKKAYCHEFISKLPDGYNSKVGDRGVMLSGGERQRIAIARAILKNAPILILDEATSALDSDSERYIQESLKELMQGKTVIAVAHRLSTLREMDKIVVMEKGKIVEEGSHTNLVRKKGVYHSFYEMQSQGFLKLD